MVDEGLMGAKAFYILLLAILMAGSISGVDAGESLVLEYFYHPSCAPCRAPKQLIEELELECSPHLVVEWRNTGHVESMERFLAYNLSKKPAVVFNHDPGTALYDMREDNIRANIEYYLNTSDNSGVEDGGADSGPVKVRPGVTLPLVVVAGLVDGINPCAFSLLIFFLSFLFSIHRGRLNVLGMGLTYILGVFVGYISLGMGLLQTVSVLGMAHPFGLFGVVFLFLMGLLQLREATGFGERFLSFTRFNPLPRPAVFLASRLTERTPWYVAFVLGCVVSLFEFPCSGGVYVGILYLLASGAYFYNGLAYLLLYNFIFVFPLILLLLLASNVNVLLKMDKWRGVNRRRMKLLSGAFLIAMASLMGYWLLAM